MDVVVGIGEVGQALLSLLKAHTKVYGDDIISSRRIGDKPVRGEVEMIHVCFPYLENFASSVLSYCNRYAPSLLVLHSTVKPGTTRTLQDKMKKPVIFSPVRGVHSRMEVDLKRYTKFYASYSHNDDAMKLFEERLRGAGIKVGRYRDPLTLEFAKILCDTTYYGWLIVYTQRTRVLCDQEHIDYDELWRFAEEIHQFLGNRPQMSPGKGIGGHCILPNLGLLDDDFFKLIRNLDEEYRKHLARFEKTI